MRSLLIAATLLLTAPLLAQNNVITIDPGLGYSPGVLRTPQYHVGTDLVPTTIDIPAVVVEETGASSSYSTVSNATPANTELLASRHFDYIVSPEDNIVAGSMDDTSISLGDYARQLRAERHSAPTPNAMARPTDCQPAQ